MLLLLLLVEILLALFAAAHDPALGHMCAVSVRWSRQ